MDLIIVESPTKARTLSRFLKDEFKIMASMGHIRDLPKSKLGVDVKNDFKPDYQIPEGKEKIAKDLQSASKKAKTVYLATDPDREGEAIAYHVKKLVGNGTKFSRITFHEITKQAILDSLKHPGSINLQLIHAQQARRVLDRLVGYQLSPLLWRLDMLKINLPRQAKPESDYAQRLFERPAFISSLSDVEQEMR